MEGMNEFIFSFMLDKNYLLEEYVEMVSYEIKEILYIVDYYKFKYLIVYVILEGLDIGSGSR